MSLETIKLKKNEAFDCQQAQAMLDRNVGNRPFKTSAIKRYANDILRKKWNINGECLIVSDRGRMLDGQNRCAAVLQAEKTRKRSPTFWRDEYGWRGEIVVPMLIIEGIPEKNLAVDSLGTGEKRTAGDVLFRQDRFGKYFDNDKKPRYKTKAQATLAKDLAVAARVVWLRIGGKDVRDAPRFPHSELVDFLKRHPRLEEMVVWTYDADAGAGEGGSSDKLISSLVSRGYVAGIAYLQACSALSRDKYDQETDPVTIKDSTFNSASEFVQTFADCTEQIAGSPILAARNLFMADIKKQETRDRDSILSTLVLCSNAYLSKQDSGFSVKDMRPGKDDPRPRIGGLDIEPEEEVEPEVAETNGEASGETSGEVAGKGKPTKAGKAKSGKTGTKGVKGAKAGKSTGNGKAGKPKAKKSKAEPVAAAVEGSEADYEAE